MSGTVAGRDAGRSHETPRAPALGRVATFAVARSWELVVWALMLGWAIVLSAIAFHQYSGFKLFGYDLGNMVQAVWSTVQGRPLEVTNGPTGEQMSRLGLHVDPILALFAPLWLAAPSPLTLVTVQVVAVALGALPVFWLARKHLGSPSAGTLLALAYLLYPWTAWAALDVFHPVVLVIPLFLFAIWFLDEGRLAPFAACAVLIAATGELMGLAVAALGIWYALARRRPRVGVPVAVVGVAWSLFAVYVIVPFFSDGESVYYSAFEHVGGSPQALARTVFTDPGAILATATTSEDLVYLVALAAPLGGLFLLAPGLAAVSLPQLGVNVLSGLGATTYPHLHYVSAILPFLVAAAVLGIARMPEAVKLPATSAFCALCAASAYVVGPWPVSHGERPGWWAGEVSAARALALREAIAILPADAPVTSTGHVRPRLAQREYVASVPTIGRAQWIVLDENDHWVPRRAGGRADSDAVAAFRARIEMSSAWRLELERAGVYVYRRVE